MDHQFRSVQQGCLQDLPVDESGLNPSATSRRRLIKALGMTGAAALVSMQWTRPIITLGGLPAHAQASVDCSVATHLISFIKDGTGSLTTSSSANGTSESGLSSFSNGYSTLATARGTGTETAAGTAVEIVGFSITASWTPLTTVSLDVSIDCCDLAFGTYIFLSDVGSFTLETSTSFGEDGLCSVLPSEPSSGVKVTAR